jgi:hypothetical protein
VWTSEQFERPFHVVVDQKVAIKKKEKLTTAHAPPVYRQANISASRLQGGWKKKGTRRKKSVKDAAPTI